MERSYWNYWAGMFCKNEVNTLRVFNKMDVRQSDRKLHRISTKYRRIFLYTFCHAYAYHYLIDDNKIKTLNIGRA